VDDSVKTHLEVANFSLLEKIAANLPGMIFQVVQQDGLLRIDYVSSGCLELWEVTPEVVKADFQILHNSIHPQDIQAFSESLLVSFKTFNPWYWSGRIITKSGKTKWIKGASHPERKANGDILWDGLVMDITVQKLAEAESRASEARYKAILDAIPDLMFRINRNGEYVDFKGEGANVTIKRQEIIGKNLWDFLPPDVASRSHAAICRTLELGSLQTCEYQLQTPLGMRDYEARLAVSGSDEVLVIVRDITESKQSLLQLHVTSLRDRLLAETLGRIRKSLNLNEILQTTVTEVRQFLHADRVFIALNDGNGESEVLAESVSSYPSVLAWKPSKAEEAQFREMRTLLETIRVRVVEDISTTQLSPTLKGLYQAFQTQATLAVPIMLGNQLSGVLIANQCSSPRNWQPMEIELLQQISEQLAIAIQQARLYQELAQLNTNLEQQVEERTIQLQQKMQQIQQLNRIKDVVLHTVSHDLRTSVMGNLMVLNNLLARPVGSRESGVGNRGNKEGEGVKSKESGEEKSTPYSPLPTPHSLIPTSIIERMIQGSERQLGMINSLLEIHSGDAERIIMHQEVVPFHTLIEAILQDTTSALNRYQAQINNLIRNNFPNVKADQELLRKVFVNLITYSCQNNPPELNFTLKAKVEAGFVRAFIQDDGVAISKQECTRFFDLYVRDPQSCSSTSASLKLYMCRQIIKAHGGDIGVTSNRKGLTFWFTLPLEEGSRE
jgi:PAS domain S-box-containing protein